MANVGKYTSPMDPLGLIIGKSKKKRMTPSQIASLGMIHSDGWRHQ